MMYRDVLAEMRFVMYLVVNRSLSVNNIVLCVLKQISNSKNSVSNKNVRIVVCYGRLASICSLWKDV